MEAIIMKKLLVALALPMTLAAQNAPAGPPKDPITQTFSTRTIILQKNIAQAFDSIPESKLSFKATPAQLSLGYIAQHLASDNYLFCNQYGAMKGQRDAEDSAPDSVKAVWPKEKLVTKLKASFTFCEQALGQLNDGNLGDQISVGGPNGTTRTVTRSLYVLGHTLDMADHYSQIANYMRLLNMLPPTALPRKP
jgi:hypothetical protein